MRKMRAWIKKYERSFMLGLVIVLLVIFTITGDIVAAFDPSQGDGPARNEVAGSFSLLPGEKVEVSYEEYDRARNELTTVLDIFSGGRTDRVSDSEAWTYLILRNAAKREGVSVSNAELNDFLKERIPGFLYDDTARYKEFIRTRYRVPARTFEEAVRNLLAAERIRDLYRQSYMVAPPTTRKEMVEQYAQQNIEYARVSWAALDARRHVKNAEETLAKSEDVDKTLEDFFKKDPGVRQQLDRFQHEKRYVFEVLYTIHHTIDDEAYQRFEALFGRAYPDLDLTKLEPTVKDMRDFFGFYRDRLLEEAGTSWDKVKAEVDAKLKMDEPEKETEPEKEGEAEEEGEPEKDKEGEPEEEGEEAEPAEDDEGEDDPEVDPDRAAKLEKARIDAGFEIVREQVDRELRVRGMYQWFRDEAAKDEKKSFKVIFDLLKQHDDAENPICSAEKGKGLIVYLEFPEGLTGQEIEDLEDRGVRFTHNFRFRIASIGDDDLPKIHPKADPLGMAAHGRQMMRLLDIKKRRRKTFQELTPAEIRELREQFYVPHAARELAKDALDELRKKAADGKMDVDAFREAASELGCRFYADEWIEASYELMSEPDEDLYWPAQLAHMKDRYFLHRTLGRVLGRDRAQKKLGPGSYLEIEVDARDDEPDDPGVAYLVLLLERRQPDADTMPPSEFRSFLGNARERRRLEERDRWSKNLRDLFNDFSVEFHGEMKKRIDDEFRRRDEATKRRR